MAQRTKNISIHFMVNEKEHELIKRQMELSGIKSMRAYMLKMAVDGRVIHVELDSVREMVRLLSNATNNINQIARRVNETGNAYGADVEDLRKSYDSIWSQTKEILRRLTAIQ